jgi:chemotaxis-related protein WspB
VLFLLFRLGDDLYALDAGRIGEVLPMVRLKSLPGAPKGIVGLINHRAAPVPVIDLSLLVAGRPASHKLSTRIVLVRDAAPNQAPHWLGLILEQATDTLRRKPEDFLSTGLGTDGAPYIGPVLPDERGLIQWIDVGKLLPGPVRRMLFRDLAERA